MLDDGGFAELIRRYRSTGDVSVRDRVFLEALGLVHTEVGRFLLHLPPSVERGDL